MICQAIRSIFWVLFWAVFSSFGIQKAKTFSGTLLLSLHHIFQPPPPPPAPPRQICSWFLHYAHVSSSCNLGAFDATDVDFFSVLTPVYAYKKRQWQYN